MAFLATSRNLGHFFEIFFTCLSANRGDLPLFHDGLGDHVCERAPCQQFHDHPQVFLHHEALDVVNLRRNFFTSLQGLFKSLV